ncbi:methyltransferase domain-containing protein [Cognatishimia sp. SS12]|uniref:class I SAM-dependent methyltransferase n=1 Tax=Cognatishimia sp. SS12 TaxID=2979465 RepID=UPI00232E8BB1|nr:class I SAM-dependent methyltransferase [Cognatishimia sp. SS12]MDC0739172.1 methyltransferase domain-containing protein [Cognatishimia sp. SS12]
MKDALTFWDGIAPKYATTPISDMQGYEATLARTRSYLKQDDHVLEIGCGTGRTALQLAPTVGEIVATDLAPAMLDVGREEAWNDGIKNIRFAQCDALNPPEGPYDVVLAHNILHLVEDLPGVLRASHAVLKPGGLLISKTFVRPSGGINFKARAMMAILPVLQWLGKAPFVKVHSRASFEASFRAAGFEIVETGGYPAGADRLYLVARKI